MTWYAHVRWHGPYRSKQSWFNAAQKFSYGLYLAIGRSRKLSLADSKVLYIGKNGRLSENPLHNEMKTTPKTSQIRGFCNEYWIGELISNSNPPPDIDVFDEARRTEKSLIYSLKPQLNVQDTANPPDYSFKIHNLRAEKLDLWNWILGSHFVRKIPGLIEFDSDTKKLEFGSVVIRERAASRWKWRKLIN